MKTVMMALLRWLGTWNINERGVTVTISFPDRHSAWYAWQALKDDAAPLHSVLPRFEIDRAEDMRATFLGVPLEFTYPSPQCDDRVKGKI